MTEETFGSFLYDALPRLGSAAALAKTLEEVESNFSMAALEEISSQINSFPGEAATGIRVELYRLLGLAVPHARGFGVIVS